jgi:hypothetical protein
MPAGPEHADLSDSHPCQNRTISRNRKQLERIARKSKALLSKATDASQSGWAQITSPTVWQTGAYATNASIIVTF